MTDRPLRWKHPQKHHLILFIVLLLCQQKLVFVSVLCDILHVMEPAETCHFITFKNVIHNFLKCRLLGMYLGGVMLWRVFHTVFNTIKKSWYWDSERQMPHTFFQTFGLKLYIVYRCGYETRKGTRDHGPWQKGRWDLQAVRAKERLMECVWPRQKEDYVGRRERGGEWALCDMDKSRTV